jgi:four helix bundle protein
MGFEKMRVYQAAERLRAIVDELRPHLLPGYSRQLRHLDEAVDSILNNAAEGSDCIYPGKKIEFFDTAKNSANEAGNVLRSLGNRKAFGTHSTLDGVTLAFTIRKMFQSLIDHLRSEQNRQPANNRICTSELNTVGKRRR